MNITATEITAAAEIIKNFFLFFLKNKVNNTFIQPRKSVRSALREPDNRINPIDIINDTVVIINLNLFTFMKYDAKKKALI